MAFWDKWFAKDEEAKPAATLIDPAVDNLMSGNAALGDLAKVQALLAAGADINAKDTGGFSPLHVAVMTGDRDTIKALLDVGGKVDFNMAAPKAEGIAPAVPAPGDPVATDEDIKVGKPLTFKPKA